MLMMDVFVLASGQVGIRLASLQSQEKVKRMSVKPYKGWTAASVFNC